MGNLSERGEPTGEGELTETVIVGVGGESGPFSMYWLATPTQEPRDESYLGFGNAYARIPKAMWDEYAKIAARAREMEKEFSRLCALSPKKRPYDL